MADQSVSILAKLQDQFSSPLEKLNAGFERLRGRLEDVGNNLDKTFTTLSAVIGGISTASAIDKSIDLAEEAVEAEQRLVAALDGRKKKTQEILDLAAQLQRTTKLEDDQLIEQAALMKRLGVNAQLLPKALKAAVNTSAALGQPLEAVVRDIALLSRGEGKGFGGRTLKLIPGIKELIDSGADIEQIVELLGERFPRAAEEVANTDFGRVVQQTNALGDAGEKVGAVFVKLKVAVLDALVPIVDKLADAVDSQQFKNGVELAKRATPIVVALAVAVAGAVSALGAFASIGIVFSFLSSLITVFTALGPAIGAVAAFLGEAALAAAPFLIALGVIVVAAVAISAIVLELTGQLDDFIDGITSLAAGAKSLAKQFGDVFKKVLQGKLEVKDLFDVLRTRLVQAQVLVAGFAGFFEVIVQDAIAFFVNGARLGLIGGKRIIFLVIDEVQSRILGAIKIVLGVLQQSVNGVSEALKTVDKTLGTNLSFDPIDLTSVIPDEIVPVKHELETMAVEIQDALSKIPKSLSVTVGKALNNIGTAFGIVSGLGDQLQERLRESERNILRGRAETIRQEVEAERQKAEAILSQVIDLQDRAAEVSANAAAIDVNSVLDENSIRQLVRTSGEDVRNELMREIETQLRDPPNRGRITAAEFVKLTKTARETSIQDESSAVSAQAQAQREAADRARDRLTILEDSIAGQDALLDRLAGVEGSEEALLAAAEERKRLEEERTDATGDLFDATSELNQLEQERLKLLLQQRDLDHDLAKIRIDSGEKVTKAIEGQRKELLDEVEEIGQLVAAGAVAPSAALNAIQTRVDSFGQAVASATDEIENLLSRSDLGPQLTDSLNAALQELRSSSDVKVPIGIVIAESDFKAAETAVKELATQVGGMSTATEEGLRQAMEATDAGIAQIQARVQSTRDNLVALSDSPGVTTEQAAQIKKLIQEIDLELNTLGAKPQLALADAIERDIRAAQDVAERELDLLARDVEQGLALPSELLERQNQVAAQMQQLADTAREALLSMAAASPDVQAAIDEVLKRLQKLKDDAQPKDLGGSTEFFGGIGTGVESTILKLGDLGQAGKQVGAELVDGLSDGLVDVFIKGRESFGEFLRSFLAGIAIMIARALLFRAISGAFGIAPAAASGMLVPAGWPASSTASFAATYPGAHRYAGGTTNVPGPRIRKDIIPAMLTPGEAVIPRSSVDFYGRRLMSRLITRSLPRDTLRAMVDGPAAPQVVDKKAFATGGIVQGAPISSKHGVQPSLIISDEQALDRLIAGGQNALDRYMRDRRQ